MAFRLRWENQKKGRIREDAKELSNWKNEWPFYWFFVF